MNHFNLGGKFPRCVDISSPLPIAFLSYLRGIFSFPAPATPRGLVGKQCIHLFRNSGVRSSKQKATNHTNLTELTTMLNLEFEAFAIPNKLSSSTSYKRHHRGQFIPIPVLCLFWHIRFIPHESFKVCLRSARLRTLYLTSFVKSARASLQYLWWIWISALVKDADFRRTARPFRSKESKGKHLHCKCRLVKNVWFFKATETVSIETLCANTSMGWCGWNAFASIRICTPITISKCKSYGTPFVLSRRALSIQIM